MDILRSRTVRLNGSTNASVRDPAPSRGDFDRSWFMDSPQIHTELFLLILTGGSSERMGTAKAGLAGIDGDLPNAERLVGLAHEIGAVAVQLGERWGSPDIHIDDQPRQGPLGALKHAYESLKDISVDSRFVILACDLYRISRRELEVLVEPRSADAVMFRVSGVVNWTAILLSTPGLAQLSESFKSGNMSLGRAIVSIENRVELNGDQLGLSDGLLDADDPLEYLSQRTVPSPVVLED